MKSINNNILISFLIFVSVITSAPPENSEFKIFPSPQLKRVPVKFFRFPDNYNNEEIKAIGNNVHDTLISDTLINQTISHLNCELHSTKFYEEEEKETNSPTTFNSPPRKEVSESDSSSPSNAEFEDDDFGISYEEYENNDTGKHYFKLNYDDTDNSFNQLKSSIPHTIAISPGTVTFLHVLYSPNKKY